MFTIIRNHFSQAALALLLGCGAVAAAAPYALLAAAAWVLTFGGDGPAPAPAAPPQQQERATPENGFVDRFASLDLERWTVSDGWSNGDWTENEWRAGQARPGQEGLTLTLAPNPPGAGKPYASGEIQSRRRFRYGYFEARLRVPRGAGLVSALFTYARDEGAPSWHEVDIEFLGRNTRVVEFTYFVGGRATGQIEALPFDAADGFHTYAIEWRPDAIRWYVDNRLAHEAAGPDVARMTREQRLYVNLWNSAQLHRWVGPIDPGEAPWALEVACVAYAPVYRGAPMCPG